MNTRLIFPIFGTALLLAATPLWAAPDHAAPVRVTTWNLQPGFETDTRGQPAKFRANLLKESAASLKKLNPDIIILQQITGWEACQQLAGALLPETYQVTICSSFRDPRTKLLSRQVAILSKVKAYLSWSDSWQSGAESPGAPGGFAFAAIHWGDKNIGVFSVQLGEGVSAGVEKNRGTAAQQAREESSRQLIEQIATLQNWKTNRLQAFILAGDFNTTADYLRLASGQTLPRLEQIGFENAFAGLPLEQRETLPGSTGRANATLDYFFTRDASVVAVPLMTQMALPGHPALTCELDLAAPKRIAAPPPQAARVESPPVNTALAPAYLAHPSASTSSSQVAWWLAGIFAVSVGVFILARKLFTGSRLQPALTDSPPAKPETRITFATPHADQIVVATPTETPPFVHIDMKGFSQTQSQTWQPRAELERVTARMPGTERAGVIASLSRWLQQKFVRRLLSDRAQLLAAQQAAALKVLAVDERLTKIEQQIQQRNQEYEKRIDDLQQELLTTREENRELIRAKIALVKAEMEKARRKTGLPAKGHQQN